MWYLVTIVLLMHYILESGEAGYWLAKKQKEKSLMAGLKALFQFLCLIYVILNFL